MNDEGAGTTIEGGTFTRRRVIAGAVGAGLATTLGIGIGRAQDEATPVAGDDADGTPVAGAVGETEEADDAITTVADAIARATAAIATAQGDRDAVAATIDTLTVDELLAQATAVHDRAQAAADATEEDQALRLARATVATARAARDLVAAQLIAAGLPSQEAPASRTLADAYEAVLAASEDAADATDADVGVYVGFAQELYQAAFDLYETGAFGRAAETARVAVHLARVAELLALAEGAVGPIRGGGRGRGARGGRDGGRGHGPGRGGDDGINPETEEPVTVPAPEF